MKSYVQVYTGNGKGKSTAVFGLCLRAVGAGMRVSVGQFLKKRHYSEVEAFSRVREIKHYRDQGVQAREGIER